jgi:hypothetical protein
MPTIRPDGSVNFPCLERPRTRIDLKAAGSYAVALAAAGDAGGRHPDCRGRCRIFCHMALSLLQGHPVGALGELRTWRRHVC